MNVPFRTDRINVNDAEISMLIDFANKLEHLDVISVPELEIHPSQGCWFLFSKPRAPRNVYPASPVADVYGCIKNEVIFIGAVLEKDGKTAQTVFYRSQKDITLDEVTRVIRLIATVYYGFQYLSLHRPEVFISSSESVKYDETIKIKNRKTTAHRVRLVKVISLNHKELKKQHKEMTCPCWNVSGHDRHYKNGKVIRIETYRKGKKRNDPNALVPKTYQIPEERQEK